MMTALAVPEVGFGTYRQEVARALSVDFDAFYRSEYAGALRFAYVLTGRMPVAEEIAQDAFLSAYGRWDRGACSPTPARGSGAPSPTPAPRGGDGAPPSCASSPASMVSPSPRPN
jgi:hypothetical protein